MGYSSTRARLVGRIKGAGFIGFTQENDSGKDNKSGGNESKSL